MYDDTTSFSAPAGRRKLVFLPGPECCRDGGVVDYGHAEELGLGMLVSRGRGC